MVSFRVGWIMYEIGTSSFLHCFFSTVAYRLENDRWGSKFPKVMNAFVAKRELEQIREGLDELLPDKVIWDIGDLSEQPPWGNNISNTITSLGNYFVTSDGRDFIEVFNSALDTAMEIKEDVLIQ